MAEYNLKNIKEDFKSKGIYYTQPELAEFMKSLIDVPIRDVYDPTCGSGNLLSVFDEELPKYGQELNDHQLEIAAANLPNFTGVCGDTLKEPAFMDKRFSCIMANPPFSIAWEPPEPMFADARFQGIPAMPPKSKADYAFILHIVHLLADEGIAVVLDAHGILFRGAAEGKLREWIIRHNLIERIIDVPGKTFIDTAIPTVCLVLKKNKSTTDVLFIDKATGMQRAVPAQEIERNDFNLNVRRYLQVQEPEDAIDLNDVVRQINEINETIKAATNKHNAFLAELNLPLINP